MMKTRQIKVGSCIFTLMLDAKRQHGIDICISSTHQMKGVLKINTKVITKMIGNDISISVWVDFLYEPFKIQWKFLIMRKDNLCPVNPLLGRKLIESIFTSVFLCSTPENKNFINFLSSGLSVTDAIEK